MTEIILASGSPRRRELLSSLGIDFQVIPADVDEQIDSSKELSSEIERLSFKKAMAVFKDHPEALVIGSDTIVCINGDVLGKPHSEEEAVAMLRELSGKTHQVITAVTILSKEESETFSSSSDVLFQKMTDDEIMEYVKTGEPMDKAGSYAIQGYGSRFIKGIRGDYYSIVGFPISEVYERLKKYL